MGFKISVDPQVAQALKDFERQGKKLIIVPNHVSMLDFIALLEVGHQAKIHGTSMSATEQFEANAFKRFMLQSMGVFSVDRVEGGDEAIVAASRNLTEDGNSLFAILGEGRIDYNGRDLDPDALKTGPARIAFSVAKQGEETLLIPLSLYYEHHSSRTEKRIQRLLPNLEAFTKKHQHADELPQMRDPETSVSARMNALVDWFMAERAQRYQLPLSKQGTPFQRFRVLRLMLLEKLETQYKGKVETDSGKTVYTRLSELERVIKRSNLAEDARKNARKSVKDLRLMFDYRPHSFDFEDPGMLAETWMKLVRNITGRSLSNKDYLAFLKDCTIHVGMAEPIDAKQFFAESDSDKPSQQEIKILTRQLGERINASLTGTHLALATR